MLIDYILICYFCWNIGRTFIKLDATVVETVASRHHEMDFLEPRPNSLWIVFRLSVFLHVVFVSAKITLQMCRAIKLYLRRNGAEVADSYVCKRIFEKQQRQPPMKFELDTSTLFSSPINSGPRMQAKHSCMINKSFLCLIIASASVDWIWPNAKT